MDEIKYNPKLDSLIEESISFFEDNYLKAKKTYIEKENSVDNPNGQKNFGSVQVYSHLDTDGLCAAAIMGRALKRQNIGYQISILTQLKESNIKVLSEHARNHNSFVIFTDFGTGQFNLLERYMEGIPFIILDHHEPLDQERRDSNLKYREVNPHLVDINGMREISGSGLAYLFARKLDEENADSSYIALIGAMGDMQDVGPQSTFIGENQKIEEEAISLDLVIKEIEPSMSRSKSLTDALAFTLPIGLAKVSFNVHGASLFLKKAGIKLKNDFGDHRTLADLSINEKKTLTSVLIQSLLQQPNTPPEKIDDLIVTNYLLKKYEDYPELYAIKDFSKLLNACGRLSEQSIGLSLLISEAEDIITKAINISEKYSQLLSESLEWAIDGNLNEMESIVAVDGKEKIPETVIGVICSHLIFDHHVELSKAVIGYAESEPDTYKVSARAAKKLVQSGVNLSTAIRNTCNELGLDEKGGGHAAASGAFVPKDKINEFLQILDKKIGQMVQNHQEIQQDGN